MIPKCFKTGLLLAALTTGQATLAATMEYSCVTEAYKDAMLSFTVAGRINQILHREGAHVKAGTALVALSDRTETLEVERRKLVMEDTSELMAAEAETLTYARLLAANRELFESTGSVSREDLSKMELEAKNSEAGYQRLLIAEQRERVEYQLAQATLAKRVLTAPFDGTIVDIQLDEGEICEPNQPLLQLVDIKRGYLICNVDESTGRFLTSGDGVPVSIQTGQGQWRGEGKVVFVAPIVDPGSGLLRVKVEFENTNGEVRPGVPGLVTLESAGSMIGSMR